VFVIFDALRVRVCLIERVKLRLVQYIVVVVLLYNLKEKEEKEGEGFYTFFFFFFGAKE
jgi:hypothetical protein